MNNLSMALARWEPKKMCKVTTLESIVKHIVTDYGGGEQNIEYYVVYERTHS